MIPVETVLVVDDERELCLTLQKVLTAAGYVVRWMTSPAELLPQLQENRFACVLLDLKLGGESGIDYLTRIREVDPHLPVILMTAFETVRTAVEAMQRGAYHYIAKPFDNEELRCLVAKAIEYRHLYWELQAAKMALPNVVNLEVLMGQSVAVRQLVRQCCAVAQTNLNVVLIGESGTGKELVATAIHRGSRYRDGPLVVVDCAAIPESLIESELFGHEKGAFTGAHCMTVGKIERAHEGSLFLDEVANIPYGVQAKFLRLLETRTFERVGGQRSITANLRVIAATNQPLPQLVKDGAFREDLYHRLNEFLLLVQPLRERVEDIPYLSLKFVHDFADQIGKQVTGISTEALHTLQHYAWPGNVRELRNAIKRAMVVASERIERADLPPEVQQPGRQGQRDMLVTIPTTSSFSQTMREMTHQIEHRLVAEALRQSEGHKGKAAAFLKIDEKTLYNKLKEFKNP